MELDSASEPALNVVHRLRALAVEMNLQGGEFARAHDLHPTDVRALICLLDAGRAEVPATPAWLGRRLDLTSASVTALIDRLERARLVERVRNPADRRSVLLRVTPRATELGWSFFGPLIEKVVAVVEARSSGEMDTVTAFLEDVRTALGTERHR